MAGPTPEARVAAARAALGETLNAIEDKFNVPKRTRAAAERIKASYRRNPAPWIAGIVGAGLVAAGAIAFVIVRRR